MRLVRLNWVAKGQTITDKSSVCTRISGVRELEAIYLSFWEMSHSKNTHLYLVWDIRSEFYTCAKTCRSDISPYFSLSLFSLSFSFAHLLFSFSNIQEDIIRHLIFSMRINRDWTFPRFIQTAPVETREFLSFFFFF